MDAKTEPIEEFPPVPTQLLWMFDGIDRKEATKMLHDYASAAITWRPSKALLRAWEDVQNATDKARRLEDKLKNRDKCSFIGPMRDCPTHGKVKGLSMEKAMIDKMVDRFLGWKLPKDFSPDGGISFKPTKPYEGDESGNSWWPIGTNLLTADQARAMIEHMLTETPNAK